MELVDQVGGNLLSYLELLHKLAILNCTVRTGLAKD